MRYKSWEKEPLELSHLGLGTVALGMPYGLDRAPPPDDSGCIALIHRALEAGITYLDTASAYGRSEEIVGKACAEASSQPFICTKVALPEERDVKTLLFHLEKQLEQSRTRLARDELPLVKLHSQQGAFTFPALFEAMTHFTERGWVNQWGVSTYGLEAPLHALSFPHIFSALQVPYSAFDRSCQDALFTQARDKGVRIIVRSIFLQGLLSGRFDATLPSSMASLAGSLGAFRACASEAGVSTAELAFRYATFNSDIDIALFGTANLTELDENLRFYEAGPLPTDLISRIEQIEVPDKRLLNPGNWPTQPNP